MINRTCIEHGGAVTPVKTIISIHPLDCNPDQQRSWSVSGGTEVALWQKPAVEAEQIRLVDGACHLENVSLDDDSLQYTDTDVGPPRGYASFEGTLGFP